MDELVLTVLDRRANALLFDVRMEGVVHHLEIRMSDLAAEASGFGGTVREVALKAVQIFEYQCDVIFLSVISDLAEHVLAPLPLVVRSSNSASSEFTETEQLFGRRKRAECRVQWAAKMRGSGGGSTVDSELQTIDGFLTNGSVRGNRILFVRADGYRCSTESQLIQLDANLREVVDVEIKDRQLDPVVADFFDFLQRPKIRLLNVGRPKQQIEAVLHREISPRMASERPRKSGSAKGKNGDRLRQSR